MFVRKYLVWVPVLLFGLSGLLYAQAGDGKKQDSPQQADGPQDPSAPDEKEPIGTYTLSISIKGQHTQDFHGPQGWPYHLNGTASVEIAVLSKGGVNVLRSIFGGLADSANAGEKVSRVSGELKVENGAVSGKVKIEWQYQGNPLFVSADLEGTATPSTVSITGKNVKVGGEWDWGGGKPAKLGGTSGKFEVKSR